jgi:hypothetical protein
MTTKILQFPRRAAVNDNLLATDQAAVGGRISVPPMLRTLLAAAEPARSQSLAAGAASLLRFDALAQQANREILAATQRAARTGATAGDSRALADAMKVLAFHTGEVAAQLDAAAVRLPAD